MDILFDTHGQGLMWRCVWPAAQRYEEPTVLLAKRVTGEEEVPEGCVAVLSPDAPDVLSHVSVRARNMRVLFAICHEEEPLQQIEQLAGKVRARGIPVKKWSHVTKAKMAPKLYEQHQDAGGLE